MMKQTKYLTNQKKTNKKTEQTNLLFGQKIKQKLKEGTYNTAQGSENKKYEERNTY